MLSCRPSCYCVDEIRDRESAPGDVSSWSSFAATADPVTAGSTGTRYFATDTRGTIFYKNAATIGLTIPTTATPVQ